MNVAIDISPLQSGHSNRGTGVYTKNLVEALKTYEKDHHIEVIEKKSQISPSTDVVHYPYFDPFFLTLPFTTSHPTVVTVHDLIPLVFPDHFPRGTRGEIKWQMQKFFLARVKRIITDSKNSKNDISKIIGFDENRIDVIPLAPSPGYVESIRSEELKKTVKKTTDGDPFILFVGYVNWNKNVPRLLSAFRKVSDLMKRSTRSLKLVCIGKVFLDDTLPEIQGLKSLMRDLHINDSVVTPGYVSDETLHILYRGAMVTVIPSLYEGFGLPVLESMVSGGLVVSSNAGSLSEIVGPAITVDPTDVESITGGLMKALRLSPTDRARQVKEQKQWGSQFTWEKVAHETVCSYARACL